MEIFHVYVFIYGIIFTFEIKKNLSKKKFQALSYGANFKLRNAQKGNDTNS